MHRFLIPLFVFFGVIAIGQYIEYESQPLPPVPITTPDDPSVGPIPEPPVSPAPSVATPEPQWTNYPPLRQVSNLGKVLSDIESHMPAGHIYRDSDKITWGHETSHGIASQLRMKYSRLRGVADSEGLNIYAGEFIYHQCGHLVFKSGAGVNGFYLLDNKAVIINEPNTTIQAAARLVPRSLRGGVYNLYMVQQARSWGDTPLYVFDEWVAYANGSAVRLDLGIQSRAETVKYMLEFNVYATCVAQASRSEDPQFKSFLMWHLDRAMELYEQNKTVGDTSSSSAYLQTMRTSPDAESFRQFARQYFGPEWTLRVLGF